MPIDPVSWEEGFEIVDEDMLDDMEDTPGFTLVVAGAALGMALFVNQRRETESDCPSRILARCQRPENVAAIAR